MWKRAVTAASARNGNTDSIVQGRGLANSSRVWWKSLRLHFLERLAVAAIEAQLGVDMAGAELLGKTLHRDSNQSLPSSSEERSGKARAAIEVFKSGLMADSPHQRQISEGANVKALAVPGKTRKRSRSAVT